MVEERKVLIIDDDATHLKIYSWILKTAGFDSSTALVHGKNIDLPEGGLFNLVILDYRLRADVTAVDAAKLVNETYPGAPIILLSDNYGLPDDIAPYVKTFVRKGEPEQLIAAVKKYALSAE